MKQIQKTYASDCIVLLVFTVSIMDFFSSLAQGFHYIVTLSELFLLDMLDQHGSSVCVSMYVCKPLLVNSVNS